MDGSSGNREAQRCLGARLSLKQLTPFLQVYWIRYGFRTRKTGLLLAQVKGQANYPQSLSSSI